MADDPLLDWVQTIGERHGFTTATCEPVRPSEVIAGAASPQSSTGEITDETAAEGQTIVQGARENAETDDHDQAGTSYAGGPNPMQSPNLGRGGYALRYGIGFLCSDYRAEGFNDLSEIAGYASPTSRYQSAFRGLNQQQQYTNPASAAIVSQIQAWTRRLAGDLEGCDTGELVVSFQGHGLSGNIYGVDGVAIPSSRLMGLARAAESQRVTITYVLDACETGSAVPEFQHHAADRVGDGVAATEGAGEQCSEDNAAMAQSLRDRMLHARELIQLSEAIGAHGTAMGQAAAAVERSRAEAQRTAAWSQVTGLNARITRQVQMMQRQFQHNMDFASDPEMRLDVIERAFPTLLTALGRVSPSSGIDLDDDWCARVGQFQDTISDGANRIIQLCNRRAREYTAAAAR